MFGLPPPRYQSGEINRIDAISRCGDEMMRVMLYEAARIMLVRLAKWSWLKAWAMKIARHRGMKKAIVALAVDPGSCRGSEPPGSNTIGGNRAPLSSGMMSLADDG